MVTDEVYTQQVWIERCCHPVRLFKTCLHGTCTLLSWPLKVKRIAILGWGVLIDFICDAPHVNSWIMHRTRAFTVWRVLACSLHHIGSMDDRQRPLFSARRQHEQCDNR